MNPILWRISILVIFALAGFGGGYSLAKMQGDAKVAAIEKERATERSSAALLLSETLQANDLLKNQIGAQNERERTIVADLDRRLASSRVRLPADLCADYGKVDATTPSESAVAASGVLPDNAGERLGDTEGGAGSYLEEVQGAYDRYIERQKDRATMTEGVMLLCRPVNEWAKAQ